MSDTNEKNNDKPNKSKKMQGFFNIILTIILTVVIMTGAFLYYLIRVDDSNAEALAEANNNTISNESLGNIIDSAVAGVVDPSTGSANTVDASAANSRKVLNENLVVLYNGLILDTTAMKKVEPAYIESTSSNKDKYVITYYNYANFQQLDSSLGILSEPVYDGLMKINNVKKYAISENYNAIPRPVQVVNQIPTPIMSNDSRLSSYDMRKVIITDLDGNGASEYILILGNSSTGYSKISIYDSSGIIVKDLAYIEKSKWESVKSDGYYLSINNVEVLDVDNDGIMEILIEIPHYEGDSSVSILKYKNCELNGEVNIECSLLP